MSALIAAAYAGNLEHVKALISQGQDVEAIGGDVSSISDRILVIIF